MGERLPPFHPSGLTGAQAAVYDRIVGGPRAAGPRLFEMINPEGGLNGPFNAMLLAPELGDALQGLGAAVRYATTLSGRIRETAILAVATYWDSAFERYAHEAVGRAAGLGEDEIAALRDLSALEPEDAHEAAALDLVRALLVTQDLDDSAYAAAKEQLSASEIFELTTLVGYYATLALLLRAFRVEAPKQ